MEVTDMKRFLSMLVALVFALTCVGTIMAAEKKAKPAGDNTVTDNTVKKAPAAKPAPKK
jgi:hypothetical protein